MSSVVPEGWISSQLGSLGVFSKGKGISKKETLPDGIPCIRYAEIYTVYDFYIKTFKSFISPITAESSRKLIKNEIIFAGSGETVEDIGKSVAFTLDCDAYVGGDSIVLSPSSDLDSTFLSYQLNDNIRRSQLRKLGQGSSVIHIYSSGLQEVILSLPPLPEQKKIASILTSVDEVIENTQKQIDKLQDLKKATMNELLTKGIGHTEFKDSELGRIPKSWEVVTLRDICKVRQGLQIPIAERFNQGGESRYPYLTVAWINSNFDANKAEFIGNPSKSVVLKSDEFVVGRTGAVGQIFDGLECVFHNNFFAVSLLHTSVAKEFLKHFLKWHLTQDLLLKLAGSTTIPDLNHGDFYSVNLRLPAPEEQQRIIRVLDHFDVEISTRERKLSQTQSLKKSLMQDLLTGKVRVTVN